MNLNKPAIRGEGNGKAVKALEDVGAFVLLRYHRVHLHVQDHHNYDPIHHHHGHCDHNFVTIIIIMTIVKALHLKHVHSKAVSVVEGVVNAT